MLSFLFFRVWKLGIFFGVVFRVAGGGFGGSRFRGFVCVGVWFTFRFSIRSGYFRLERRSWGRFRRGRGNRLESYGVFLRV